MRLLNHPNVVLLKSSFFTSGNKPTDDVYLNLVLEYVPETVYRVARAYTKQKQHMPVQFIKVYIYQLLKALEYIHGLGVCHRDIKPQNLLLDPPTGVLKLCDFGSAKILVQAASPTSPTSAPATTARPSSFVVRQSATPRAIDLWSHRLRARRAACSARRCFPARTAVDQLVEIIKVLGTPIASEQLIAHESASTPSSASRRSSRTRGRPRLPQRRTPLDAIDLVSRSSSSTCPTTRLNATTALRHTFFDKLKEKDFVLPNGKPLPKLDGIN
jgi:glycogen synthase kinase 3 beta